MMNALILLQKISKLPEELERHADSLHFEYLKCPFCLSDDVHQISYEKVEYCEKDQKIVKVRWNSDFQDYKCQNCNKEWGDL